MFLFTGSAWGRVSCKDQHHADYFCKVHLGSLTHHVQMDTYYRWSPLRPHLCRLNPPVLSFSLVMPVPALSSLLFSWRLPTCTRTWPPSCAGTGHKLLMDTGATHAQLQPPRGWCPPPTPLFCQQVLSLHRQDRQGGWHPSEELPWQWVDAQCLSPFTCPSRKGVGLIWFLWSSIDSLITCGLWLFYSSARWVRRL